MTRRLLLLLTVVLSLADPAAAQESPDQKGLRIATEAREHDAGFGSFSATGEMILRDRRGKESIRRFRSRGLEVAEDGDKSLLIFDWPGDIAGTGVLTIAHRDRDDEQWLYLPAVKRVKRISTSNQSGSFVGTEFTYEDLTSPELYRFTYKWIRDEPCPGAPDLQCYLLERYPTRRESGYSRHVAWMDQENYRIYRVEFFDRKGALLKTMTVEGYALYANRHWRPARAVMENHQNGKSTVMNWQDYNFSNRFDQDDFTSRALERAR